MIKHLDSLKNIKLNKLKNPKNTIKLKSIISHKNSQLKYNLLRPICSN